MNQPTPEAPSARPPSQTAGTLAVQADAGRLGAAAIVPLKGAKCRGSKSACADLDGTRASRVPRLATPAARRSRFRGVRLIKSASH